MASEKLTSPGLGELDGCEAAEGAQLALQFLPLVTRWHGGPQHCRAGRHLLEGILYFLRDV